MDWDIDLDAAGTHFPPPTVAPTSDGQYVLLFFLILGVIWLLATLWEWAQKRINQYFSPENVRRRQEQREAELEQQHCEEQQRRERAEECQRQQREREEQQRQEAQERERRRQAIPELASWYQQQRGEIEAALPPGHERDTALDVLFERYDHLLKEKLRGMQP